MHLDDTTRPIRSKLERVRPPDAVTLFAHTPDRYAPFIGEELEPDNHDGFRIPRHALSQESLREFVEGGWQRMPHIASAPPRKPRSPR
jgi:hypothetical protein